MLGLMRVDYCFPDDVSLLIPSTKYWLTCCPWSQLIRVETCLYTESYTSLNNLFSWENIQSDWWNSSGLREAIFLFYMEQKIKLETWIILVFHRYENCKRIRDKISIRNWKIKWVQFTRFSHSQWAPLLHPSIS